MTTVDTRVREQDRSELALDSLSRLARQFAEKPDFDRLAKLLLLTVAGQFSVHSGIVAFRNPDPTCSVPKVSTLGVFAGNPDLVTAAGSLLENKSLVDLPEVWVTGTPDSESIETESASLISCGVRTCARICDGDRPLAIVCLGDKVTGQPASGEEIAILTDLIGAVTPLLTSSYLFARLEVLNRWHQSVIDNVNHGVFVFDGARRLKQYNAMAGEIVEFVASQRPILGQSMAMIFPDSLFPGWVRGIADADRAKRGEALEHLKSAGTAEERIYRLGVSRVASDGQGASDLIVTLDDITAHKRSESRLFELEKMAERGMMVSSIAHELNNFLALLMGGTELAAQMLSRGNLEKTATYLEKLKSNVDKMERFTSGLTARVRLNAEKSKIDLNGIIADVISFAQLQKRFAGVTLEIDLAQDVPTVEMDGDQIAQVLMNLLNNAADAISLAERPQGSIKVQTFVESNQVVLRIADNGTGVKDELRDKLFRSHFTTKENGHGYGLVTCGEIIRNHGGRIEITSTWGEGTEFQISFPIPA